MGRSKVKKWFCFSKMREAFNAKGYNADEVIQTLRRYTKEEFRMTQTTCSQPHAIESVQNMLEKEYSNLFKGNSGSELKNVVKRYIMRTHTNARTYSKARGRLIQGLSGNMSENKDNEEESEVEFVDPAVTKSPFAFRAQLFARPTPLMPIVASPTRASAVVAITSNSNYMRTSEASSSRTSSQRRIAHRYASSRSSLTRNQDVEAVEIFLNSCFPPMAHFLERFLSYGCRNAQFLRFVSTLPRDSIVMFIRSLPCLDGQAMSEMEVFLLTENFLNYSQ